jgi:prefoldin subunit 5
MRRQSRKRVQSSVPSDRVRIYTNTQNQASIRTQYVDAQNHPQSSIHSTPHHIANNQSYTLNQQKSIESKSNKHISKIGNKSQVIIAKVCHYLKITAKKIAKFSKSLPWKQIGTVSMALFFVVWASIHFFFASADRIVVNFNTNYTAYENIETGINGINIKFKRLNKDGLKTIQSDLEKLSQISVDTEVALPPKFFVNYALRNEPEEYKIQIESLYKPANSPDLVVITEGSKATAEATRLILALLDSTDSVEKDTEGYISFLREAIETLQEQDASDNVDLATIIKIFTYINEAALQYQISGDKNGFDARYSNLSSELLKELSITWEKSSANQHNRVSAQRSTLESLINLNSADSR